MTGWSLRGVCWQHILYVLLRERLGDGRLKYNFLIEAKWAKRTSGTINAGNKVNGNMPSAMSAIPVFWKFGSEITA